MRTYTRRNVLRQSLEPIEGVLGLCRLCLEEAKESIPIFANKSDICNSLAMRIMMCVGYEVTHDDCLPNTICTECHKELNKFYEFRKKCTSTYHKLKTHLSLVQVRKASDLFIKTKQQEQNKSLLKPIDSTSVSSRNNLPLSDNTNLEIKVPSILQNGLDNIVNCLLDGTYIKGVKDTMEGSQNKLDTEVCPDVTQFLSSILLEMGILKKQDDKVVVAESFKTIHIETGDCESLSLEIYEIEEETDETNRKENIKSKETNEKIKSQCNERARCPECGKRFASGAVARRHARTHSGERPYRCAHCGRAFAQLAVARRHELVHQEVRPFACAHCPKSFTQRSALAAHARSHAAPAARPLELHRCTQCPKVFLHASGLSRHAMVHSGRVYVCPQCARRFSDNSSLRRHVRIKHAPRQEI